MGELIKKGLKCYWHDASRILVCSKAGIRTEDFFDLQLVLQGTTYTVPARELVEMVYPVVAASARSQEPTRPSISYK